MAIKIYSLFVKLKIYSIGKLSLKSVDFLVREYVGRIGHYLSIEIAKLKTGEEIFSKLKPQDWFVCLDERGKSFASVEFAKWIETQKLRSIKSLVFLVGPAEGLSGEIKKQANLLLSLSSMTLQHELALVVLLEQIYRACTILKGEPYHK